MAVSTFHFFNFPVLQFFWCKVRQNNGNAWRVYSSNNMRFFVTHEKKV